MPSVIRAMLDRCQLAVSSRGVAAGNTNDEAQGLPRRRTSKEAIVRPPPQAVPTPGERVSGESLHLVRTPNRTATRRDLFVHEVEWRDDHGNRFIKIPYEEYFHRNYDKTKARYERSRGADRSVTPVRGQHSRSGSSNSVNVGEGIAPGEPSTASAEQSPRWPTLPNESTSSEQLQAGQQGSLRLEVPSVPRAQRASASG
jgi:hypothetical protein